MKKVTMGAKPQSPAPRDPDAWVRSEQAEAEPMKRLTIDVPISLHRRIKTQCAARDVKMADEVRSLLEKHFPENPTAGSQAA